MQKAHLVHNLGLVFGFVLAGQLTQAQQSDFSGDWKLKSQEFVAGSHYGNAMPKSIGLTQDKDSLRLDRAYDDGQGNLHSLQESASQDGEPGSSFTKSNRKKIVTLTWSADNSKMESRNTDSYSVDAAGLLTIDHKSENFTNGDNYECKGVYGK